MIKKRVKRRIAVTGSKYYHFARSLNSANNLRR